MHFSLGSVTLSLGLAACIAGSFTGSAAARPNGVFGVRQDLAELLAPPTAQEIALVRADWAARQVQVDGFMLEATGFGPGTAQVHVISHIVDGQRHYGALRFPDNYSPTGVYRVIVLCHGGIVGVDLDDITSVLTVLSGGCIEDDTFLLIPSYRGEDLETSFAGTFASGGMPSYADRDVDDTLGLLSVALREYPQMDEARISVWGVSRGASVALLASIRDERFRRVVDNFGFTDLSLPSVRARVEEIQNNGVQPAGIGQIAWETSVQPWLSGTMSLAEARLAWIRRSPCYFAADLPEVQAHHGLADTQVDPSHTSVLLDELTFLGVRYPVAQGYFYPGGGHNVASLVGYGPRARDFLCAGRFQPRGYCAPTVPTSEGLYTSADYRGTASVNARNFVFRANDVLPNSVGLVFVGPASGYTPAGAGVLCLGAGFQRAGVATSNANGVLELFVDFATQNPFLSPLFDVGGQAHFQVAFRDLLNPFGTFNFSNGLAVTVLP